MEQVCKDDLKTLIQTFSKRMYRAKDHDSTDEIFHEKCVQLVAKDYVYSIIKNDNGELSTHYPKKIIIQERDKNDQTSTNSDKESADNDASKLREFILKAKNARCRTRFPLPVLLFDKKPVCRSGTLSGGPEIYGRSGYDFLFSGSDRLHNKSSSGVHFDDLKTDHSSDFDGNGVGVRNSSDGDRSSSGKTIGRHSIPDESTNDEKVDKLKDSTRDENGKADIFDGEEELLEDIPVPQNKTEWQLFSKVRSQDIRLLKWLNVQYIIDLMVEKKKVKFGINVTSSEKVDKENRYSDFTIMSLPYPGCEFFRIFRDQNYSADNLIFEWNQSFVDAQLVIPNDNISSHIRIDWNNYKKWDLILLTKNYLRLILKYLNESKSGMLIHCISGWDRTPLFISLVRLSLWADGKIHSSLGPYEILYFVIAYDWYFFGHNLVDRLDKGEEIFFFLFFVLKYLTSDQFSVCSGKPRTLSASLRNESDVNIDGVLLESSFEAGSNTSLNSVGSSTSNRSSVEGVPINFSGPPTTFYVDGYYPSKNHSQTIQPNPNISPKPQSITKSQIFHDSEQKSCRVLETSTDTLVADCPTTLPVPVPVPSSNNRATDTAACSSWQVISETGSLSGSTQFSVGSSYLDMIGNMPGTGEGSDQSYDSCRSFGHFSLRSRRPSTPRTRRDRLKSVRDVFYSIYSTTIGFRHQNSDGSSISTIFEHVVEKMGIKSSKPYPV